MKKAATNIPAVHNHAAAPTTDVELPARETPLTPDQFDHLEALLQRRIDINHITKTVFEPLLDNEGRQYGSTPAFKTIGIRPEWTGRPSQKLLEAIIRPSSPVNTVMHLRSLAAHLHYTGGTDFAIKAHDIARDLVGCSEWAIMRACKWFRQNTGPFFPQTNLFEDKVREFHSLAIALQNTSDAPRLAPPQKKPARQPPPPLCGGRKWPEFSEADRNEFFAAIADYSPSLKASMCRVYEVPQDRIAAITGGAE